MYENSEDYLTTYDPHYFEEHDDSTDFEENTSPLIDSKNGNHSLLNILKLNHHTPKSNFNHHKMYAEYDQYPVKLKSDVIEKIQGVDKEAQASGNLKTSKVKDRNRGDQVSTHTLHSKPSSLRHKLIPCISSFFRRAHKKDQMSTIKEHMTSKDNCSQFCSYCERRRLKKLYKQEVFAVKPIYAMGGEHKLLTPSSQATNEKHYNSINDKCSHNYSTYTVTSSSDSDSQLAKERIKKERLLRQKFKRELLKERLKYEDNRKFKNRHLQFPSKEHRSQYQVFSSPCHHHPSSSCHQSRDTSDLDLQYLTGMQSSSSGFWDYLFEKFHRKYLSNRMELTGKPCGCGSGHMALAANCKHNKNTSGPPSPKLSESCPPQPVPSPKQCPCLKAAQISKKASPQEKPPGTQMGLSLTQSPSKEKPNKEEAMDCKCYEDKNKNKDKKIKKEDSPLKLPPQKEFKATDPHAMTSAKESRPCQQCHDQITSALANKYKGEILCIHNPPCILINGCLNLPPPKDQNQMSCWPILETKKPGFGKKNKHINKEQGCQYHEPFVDVMHCEVPRYKSENIQSICPHIPPCEVVRGCYKVAYDPKLQNSCVHVPMCDKIPECTMGKGKSVSCDHNPKCFEVPVCSRKYYNVLTATEDISTQVKGNTAHLVCRHVPPCILVPKCVGKAMCESYLEVLPNCTHRPCCDMIPACCKKTTKEMVSASSQYPNSCRIV